MMFRLSKDGAMVREFEASGMNQALKLARDVAFGPLTDSDVLCARYSRTRYAAMAEAGWTVQEVA